MFFKKKGTIVGDQDIEKKQVAGTNKLRQERNRAYLFIGFLLLIITVQAVAILGLTPLKTVVPAIVTVDTHTGRVVKVQITTPDQITANEAVIQNDLYEYILNRNTADWKDRQRLSDLVHLHSTETVASQYKEEISQYNPNSPYLLMGPNGNQRVEVVGIVLLNKDTAQISYTTTLTKPGQETLVRHWIATVQFKFTGKPLTFTDRWENPLGFLITSYRKDQQLSKPNLATPE